MRNPDDALPDVRDGLTREGSEWSCTCSGTSRKTAAFVLAKAANLAALSKVVSRKCFRGGVTERPVFIKGRDALP
jgi:hypothetical protein